MESKLTGRLFLFIPILLTILSCDSRQQPFASPPGYDLERPVVYKMPDILREISGITFNNQNKDTIYAEQDEEGKVFHFHLGDEKIQKTHFWKKGDFEDITISNGYVIMLRSDGTLFTFPLNETNNPEAQNIKTFETLLPAGEYEGLSVGTNGKIYALCKHCQSEKTSRTSYGYIFQLTHTGDLISDGNFEMDVSEIEKLVGVKKINFHPSALAQKPGTGEWFILSAVNKLLVITDDRWKVKSIYPLNPALFPQPEGIAFDAGMNLYIFNERNQAPAATILLFGYKHK